MTASKAISRDTFLFKSVINLSPSISACKYQEFFFLKLAIFLTTGDLSYLEIGVLEYFSPGQSGNLSDSGYIDVRIIKNE